MTALSLPDDVATELVDAGVAQVGERATEGRSIDADVIAYALIVFHTANTVVTMWDVAERVQDIAAALWRWMKRAPAPDAKRPYVMNVEGPGGSAKLDLSEVPDEAAIAAVLRSVWSEPK